MTFGQKIPAASSREASHTLLGCSGDRVAAWLALLGCAGVSATLAAAGLYIARELIGTVSTAFAEAGSLARQTRNQSAPHLLFGRTMASRATSTKTSPRRGGA